MRIAKEGSIRKNEILDITLTLFYEKGYERTTIEDILNKTGISKGTFYYYFETKEEVLNVLAWREAEKRLELTRKVAEDENLSAIDKINKIVSEAQKLNFTEIENRTKIFKMVEDYGNLQFKQRLIENSIQLGAPLIQSMLEQGIAENTMKIDYPEEVANFYIEMMNRYKASVGRIWFTSQDKTQLRLLLKEKTQFYQDLFEKVMGVEEGQLQFSAITLKHIDEL